MGTKQKGSNAERDLIKRFWAIEGWCAHRIAGSGSNHYPSPDIIAGSRTRKIAIEAKITSSPRKYFEEQEILDLKKFCEMFAAEPWVAIKFPRTEWLFLSLDDLEFTGSSYSAKLETAKLKGVSIEELTGE